MAAGPHRSDHCPHRGDITGADITTALADPAKLRTVLLAYTEKVMALEAKVQEQAPKDRKSVV